MIRIIALAELAAFYACYFGKMLAQRRQGIRTDQLGSGKTGRQKYVELGVMILSVTTVLAELVSIAAGTTALPDWLRWTGAVIAAAGVALFITAVVTMRDSWRAGVPQEKTELVTGGVFRISRNPAFVGSDLVYVGMLLMFFNWALAVITLAAMTAFHLQIIWSEEPALERMFGEAYTDYCGRVRRYLGRK